MSPWQVIFCEFGKVFRVTSIHNSTLTLNTENICETDNKYIADRSPNNNAMTNVTVEIF